MSVVALVVFLVVVLAPACGSGSPVLQLKFGPVSEDELREYLRSSVSDEAHREDVVGLCVLSRGGAEDAEVAGRVAELLGGDGTVDVSLNSTDVAAAAKIVAKECARLFLI